MVVQLLVRNSDGPAGRQAGDIVSWKEGAAHDAIEWGRSEGPPNYTIVEIDDCSIDDIIDKIGRHVPTGRKIFVGTDDEQDEMVRSRGKISPEILNIRGGRRATSKSNFRSVVVDRVAEQLAKTKAESEAEITADRIARRR